MKKSTAYGEENFSVISKTDFKTCSKERFFAWRNLFTNLLGWAKISLIHFFSVLLIILGVWVIVILLVNSVFDSINKGYASSFVNPFLKIFSSLQKSQVHFELGSFLNLMTLV